MDAAAKARRSAEQGADTVADTAKIKPGTRENDSSEGRYVIYRGFQYLALIGEYLLILLFHTSPGSLH
jgi:hypothetical protein